MKEYLCLIMDCRNKVKRHPYNFDGGMCNECRKKRDREVIKLFEL